jgi:hypothetical protein
VLILPTNGEITDGEFFGRDDKKAKMSSVFSGNRSHGTMHRIVMSMICDDLLFINFIFFYLLPIHIRISLIIVYTFEMGENNRLKRFCSKMYILILVFLFPGGCNSNLREIMPRRGIGVES